MLVIDVTAKVYLRKGFIVASGKEGDRLKQSLPDLKLVVIIGKRILLTGTTLLTLASNNILIVLFGP